MKKLFLALSCVMSLFGLTSCEMDHHEHRGTTTTTGETTTTPSTDRIDRTTERTTTINPNLNR